MMKVLLLSDLHFEFHSDNGSELLNEIDQSTYDVLVLAGDIDISTRICVTLERISALAYPRPVLFVAGNHEFYHASLQSVRSQIFNLTIPNFHYLQDQAITLEGQRFLGTTLWFTDHPLNTLYEKYLGDFRHIQDFKTTVYEENKEALAFLSQVQPDDVVITHHLPSFLSVPPQHKTSKTNRFFVCNCEKLIQQNKPKLWLHGHTHVGCDYILGDTRVVANPYGYHGLENPVYKTKLIEVGNNEQNSIH
tara:strand:+ start:292 stop:1038 length:747 start_codon:yes stop_codon:yes gene_type:complete